MCSSRDAMSAGDNCGGGVITGEGNEVTSKSRGRLYSLHVRTLQTKPTRSKHTHRLRTGQRRLSHATDLPTLEFSFPCQGYDACVRRSAARPFLCISRSLRAYYVGVFCQPVGSDRKNSFVMLPPRMCSTYRRTYAHNTATRMVRTHLCCC